MIEAIQKENRHNLMFIHENKLTMNIGTEGYFKNFWDIDTEDSKIKKYVRMIEGVPMHNPPSEDKTERAYSLLVTRQKLDTFVATLGF